MRRTVTVVLAVLAVVLVAAPNAQAATDEQRLAAHLHGAEVAFPATCERVVHLHGTAEIDAEFPGMEALGMTRGCDIWLRSGLERTQFRYALYHEMAHTAGWEHGPEMYAAIWRALGVESVPRTTASSARRNARSARRAFLRARRAARRTERRAAARVR